MTRWSEEVETKRHEATWRGELLRRVPGSRWMESCPSLIEVIKLDQRDSGRAIFPSNDGRVIGWE